MSDFYTSVIPYGNDLLVRGIQGGETFSDKVPYSPTLYHKFKDKSRYRSLTEQYLIPTTSMGIKIR